MDRQPSSFGRSPGCVTERPCPVPYDFAELLDGAASLDIWSKGTCYDTVNENANESGPASGQIAEARHTQTFAGGTAPLLLGRASCNLAPLGL